MEAQLFLDNEFGQIFMLRIIMDPSIVKEPQIWFNL